MNVSIQDHSQEISSKDILEPELGDATPPKNNKTTLQAPCKEPQIYLHDLSSFLAYQTLKFISYIKNLKVIILMNNENTQNFINRRVSKETHCYVYPIANFQIMISNGGMMKFGD
jgi:hypothetical protein